MSLLLYNISVRAYGLLLWLLAPFHAKARLFVRGRKGFFSKIKHDTGGKKVLWFHCASLGEFEQARPLIESFDRSSYYLLVSFYSPSGYEAKKNYAYADRVCYLPLDSVYHAKKWFDTFRPHQVFFIKYEFWYHYISEAGRRKIPIYLVSAVFREKQIFFKPYGGMFRRLLRSYAAVFVQDEKSYGLVEGVRKEGVYLTGDTRFDRVAAVKQQATVYPDIEKFRNGKRLLLLGSSWPPEEKIVAEYLERNRDDIKILIAPHDIGEERVREISSIFGSAPVTWTNRGAYRLEEEQVLVVNTIGMLSSLYRYADFALVGGAFGKGLHNILEAAVYGVPVFFGPRTEKFYEAAELEKAGGGFTIHNSRDFEQKFRLLAGDQALYKEACHTSGRFCAERTGATARILGLIYHS